MSLSTAISSRKPIVNNDNGGGDARGGAAAGAGAEALKRYSQRQLSFPLPVITISITRIVLPGN